MTSNLFPAGLQQNRPRIMSPSCGSPPDPSIRHAVQRTSLTPQGGLFKAPMPPQQELGAGGRSPYAQTPRPDYSQPTDLHPQPSPPPPHPDSSYLRLDQISQQPGGFPLDPYTSAPGTPRPPAGKQPSAAQPPKTPTESSAPLGPGLMPEAGSFNPAAPQVTTSAMQPVNQWVDEPPPIIYSASLQFLCGADRSMGASEY